MDEKNNRWLMIVYRVPSSPSTSRVTVWKRLKELGAYQMQQSLYILPNRPEVKEKVAQLRDLVERLGGESKIIEIASFGVGQENEVIAGFNKNREEEYAEVIKACTELLNEINEESRTEDFHFADLEENEKHLQRVKELFESVESRDYFSSPLHEQAASMVDDCRRKFEAFGNEVYSRAESGPGEEMALNWVTKSESMSVGRQALGSKIGGLIQDLMQGNLEIGGQAIGKLPREVMLDYEYKEDRQKHSLEIKISWAVPEAKK